jgi:hypothetical protein
MTAMATTAVPDQAGRGEYPDARIVLVAGVFGLVAAVYRSGANVPSDHLPRHLTAPRVSAETRGCPPAAQGTSCHA